MKPFLPTAAVRGLALAAGVLAFAACGGDSTGGGGGNRIASLTITAPAGAAFEPGATVQMVVTAKNSSGETVTASGVTWTSSDTMVARITTSGLLTAKRLGGTTLTASAGPVSTNFGVTVGAPALGSVVFEPDTATIPASSLKRVPAVARSRGGAVMNDRVVIYRSLDESFATVDAAGVVATKKVGTVKIEASVDDKADTATITIGAPRMDITALNAVLTQVVQRPDNSIPLIAGRDAFVRIFARASEDNQTRPAARLNVYHGATLVHQQTLNLQALATTPLDSASSNLATSWNGVLAGNLIVPGMRVQVEVNHDGAVPEANPANNTWPAAAPLALDVRAVEPHRVKLVRVHQTLNDSTGKVPNPAAFTEMIKQLWPVPSVDVQVRPEIYSTGLGVFDGDDANGSWSSILDDMTTLKEAEGNTTHYYYGVLRVGYGGGIAGLGWIGLPAAVGWDKASGAEVYAHETGHNFTRRHAPCGGVGGPDPNFPYANGAIGVWGIDPTNGALKAPGTPDIMGYCNNPWVSDYSYNAVIAYRQNPNHTRTNSQRGIASGTMSLVVRGRVGASGIRIDPAFQIDVPGRVPTSGSYTLEGLDGSGQRVFAFPFEPAEIGDAPRGADRGFVLSLAVTPEQAAQVAQIRVTGEGRSATRTAARGPRFARIAGDRPSVGARRSGRYTRVEWDATQYPLVVVRNPATGAILSFARGGRADVLTNAAELELTMSNGVQSRKQRVTVDR
jgi:hypothetical protein